MAEKKTGKYTSHDMQNEILRKMAHTILCGIATNLQRTEFFTMMDECADKSNQEQVSRFLSTAHAGHVLINTLSFFCILVIQLVVVMRWVDDTLSVYEDFLGLYAIPSIEASSIVSAVRDTMIRLNLPVTKVRGQCYDGASNMSGLKKGVATQLQEDEPRAIYMHCYGHSLNLAVGDAVRQCKVMKVALQICFEITKLIKYSPRRESLFKDIKEEVSLGLLVLECYAPQGGL